MQMSSVEDDDDDEAQDDRARASDARAAARDSAFNHSGAAALINAAAHVSSIHSSGSDFLDESDGEMNEGDDG